MAGIGRANDGYQPPALGPSAEVAEVQALLPATSVRGNPRSGRLPMAPGDPDGHLNMLASDIAEQCQLTRR